MKNIFLITLFFFYFAASVSHAQSYKANPSAAADAEIERQKILRAADSIEDMRSQVESMNTQFASLKKEIADLQEENKTLKALNKTLLDNDKKIEEAIRKVDTAREADRKQIADDLKKGIEEIKKAQATQAKEVAAAQETSRQKASKEKAPSEAKEMEYYEHTVESGHTLASIARVYEVKVEDIQKANKIKGSNIRVGQKLLIPKK